MKKCKSHPEYEATYICLYSECKQWKTQNYYLCQQCLFEKNDHQTHSDVCILIQDIINQLQGQFKQMELKEKQTEKYISMAQNQLQQLKKKKMFVQGLLEKLRNYKEGLQTRILPQTMSELERHSLKVKQLKSEVETYQVQYEKLAENFIECNCGPNFPIKFLRIEKDINLGKRTICDECYPLDNDKNQQNKDEFETILSIDRARKIIQYAEQEELYINEITRVKQEQSLIQNKITQTFTKLEILDNYKSMYFNEALTIKRRSVKNILNENPSRSQYQQLAEFLSSYYQKPNSEEKYDFRELTNVFTCFKTILALLDDLDQRISTFDVFQKGYLYTVICEIYKIKDYEQTKILVIKETFTVSEFMNLITKLYPNISKSKEIQLNQQKFVVKKNHNTPFLQIIMNYGNYGKLKLIY